MSENQLPQWAIEAGWTEQDLADGWRVEDRWFAIEIDGREFSAWNDGDVMVYNGEETILTTATSPAAARQCALDIVAAVKRARGEQG